MEKKMNRSPARAARLDMAAPASFIPAMIAAMLRNLANLLAEAANEIARMIVRVAPRSKAVPGAARLADDIICPLLFSGRRRAVRDISPMSAARIRAPPGPDSSA
jgi:hypothetical protein